MLENIGSSELLLVLFIAFIFFGPRTLPQIGKTLGKASRELKNALRGIQDDINKSSRM